MNDPKLFLFLAVGLAAVAGFLMGWLAAELFRSRGAGRRSKSQKFGTYQVGNPRSRASRWKIPPGKRVAVIVGAIAICAAVYLGQTYLSPWPAMVTLKHLAAFPNCAAARAVGFAPTKRGEPGYWPHHDRDGDGIACEPWRYR